MSPGGRRARRRAAAAVLAALACVPLAPAAAAAPPEPADPCARAKRVNGWCASRGAGYVASVEIRSRALYEALDAHGHPIDRKEVACATCRAAIDADGFCADHRMGYVGGLAYLSPLTYHLARGRMIDPASLACPRCRAHTRGIGWCDEHAVGIAGVVAVDDRARFDALREAYGILTRAVEKSAACETCAAAMIADGYCAEHRLRYRGGRQVEPAAP